MRQIRLTTALLLVCMLLMAAGCKQSEEKHSDLVFNLTKTTGQVITQENGKLSMKVSEDDKYFKAGDTVVVTFQSLYLKDNAVESDVLSSIDSVKKGDTVYVLYKEEEKKDKIINVEYAVKNIN